jgi:hypothetical protein
MRTILLAVAVLAAVTVTAASGSTTAQPTVIHTLQTITHFTPTGKPGVGTVWTGEAVHVDPSTGKRVGHGWAVCIQFKPGPYGAMDCQGDDHLPGGDIREAGAIADPAKLSWAIVGGTGRFANATGTYEADAIGKSTTKSRVTFTLANLAG